MRRAKTNGHNSVKKKENPNLSKLLKKENKSKFQPSMKTIIRIIESVIEKGAEDKTSLSLDANLNYARLAKHIVWLEKKGLVESTIEESRINVGLTEKGKLFAKTILD